MQGARVASSECCVQLMQASPWLLLRARRHTLSTTQLSGPTLFAPLIKATSQVRSAAWLVAWSQHLNISSFGQNVPAPGRLLILAFERCD